MSPEHHDAPAADDAERRAALAALGTARPDEATREHAHGLLKNALSAGRIRVAELTERTGQVLEARTHEQLDAAVARLDGTPPSVVAARAAAAAKEAAGHRMTAAIHDVLRRGAWTAPNPLTLFPYTGAIELNLQHVSFDGDVLRIAIEPGIGPVRLVCPPGSVVDASRLERTGRGKITNALAAPDGDAPPLRVEVTGALGAGSFVARLPRFYER